MIEAEVGGGSLLHPIRSVVQGCSSAPRSQRINSYLIEDLQLIKVLLQPLILKIINYLPCVNLLLNYSTHTPSLKFRHLLRIWTSEWMPTLTKCNEKLPAIHYPRKKESSDCRPTTTCNKNMAGREMPMVLSKFGCIPLAKIGCVPMLRRVFRSATCNSPYYYYYCKTELTTDVLIWEMGKVS